MGTWFAKNPSLRKDVVVGTKVLGYVKDCDTIGNRTVPPTPGLQDARLDRKSILLACEGSLRRLQTDYIDLYQLHWPDRYARVFGPRVYDVKQERPDSVSFEEQLGAIKELLDAGKIRSWGLSNETPYGIAEFVHTADRMGLPRPASIQNEFNLFDRSFECYLAESCSPGNYNLGLLPWSILAGGALTGKYQGKLDKEGNPLDESVKESRLVLFNFFQGRFRDPKVWDTISAYEAIAKEAGMSVATMAQAFCKSRWFIPSSIIGATRMTQLEENIDAFGVELSDDILRKIDEVHAADKDITVTVF